MLHIKEYT